MEVYVDPGLRADLAAQLDALHRAQTAPWRGVVADYAACLRQNRELDVRVAQLDKEAAELRDEVSALTTRAKAFDAGAARDFATRAEALRQDLSRAQSELASVYRDKSKALEDLIAAQRARDAALASASEAQSNFEARAEEVAALKARLGELGARLDGEAAARQLAANEAEARLSGKEAAEARAAKVEAENAALMQRLLELQDQQAEKLDLINRMHEEMVEHSRRQQLEQAADKQLLSFVKGGLGGGGAGGQQQQQPGAAQLGVMQAKQVLGTLRGVASGAIATALLGRRGSGSEQGGPAAAAAAAALGAAAGTGPSQPAAAGGPGPASPRGDAQQAAAAAGGGEFVPGSLKQLMGLPAAPAGPVPERALPSAPAKSFPAAHKGTVCSVAVMRPGHFVATCGTDRGVLGWDLNTLSSSGSFHGAAGTVNDVAFTQDGRRLLAACGDKRIVTWAFGSAQPGHTLTGHGGGVLAVSCSPLDAAVAVSAGEDRCVKVWDLQRGFCVRSLPCAKMPSALALSLDGTTILTGHLDGSLCLWDMRQDRAGGKALAELRDSAQTVLSLSPHWGDDSTVLTASKDSTLRLWDFRALSVTQTLKAPGFSIGCVGSMGRGRCTCDISADGRFVAAGAADGSVFVWDLKPTSRRRTSDAARGGGAGGGGGGGRSGSGGAGPPVTRLTGMKEQVAAVGWSYDCTSLVTADKTGGVAFWQLTGGGA
ncbi:hypothetical protein Rsub_01513 [Raphidocelis subcapitata]|uniref:Autophagy-related protein 16 domain-containing protein n=1 Tax=Raphidocelis subcapitata TaxID=307507 RepID=A0A2V0NN96_9CHLO|nr:hypothetical protein Rsub_01513 [Raphidocelis subcapitata]|eukprot:GBF89014.1 hypothetical protein Rsub_01513 [Raphidocelis subcapitata]